MIHTLCLLIVLFSSFQSQSSPLYTSCLNVHIVDIGYPQGICLSIFAIDDSTGLFLHTYLF